MALYEPTAIAAWLEDVFSDAALVALLPGGVHENDASDGSPTPGAAQPRRETPYLIYGQLAGAGDIQGAGGTVLVADLDYGVQVLYVPGQEAGAREALGIVQGLLEGVEHHEAASGTVPAYNIVSRARGTLPRIGRREPMARLIYSEGRRWRFRVQRATA
jgi:hypothetical protein